MQRQREAQRSRDERDTEAGRGREERQCGLGEQGRRVGKAEAAGERTAHHTPAALLLYYLTFRDYLAPYKCLH